MRELRSSLVAMLLFTALCGGVYPLLVGALALAKPIDLYLIGQAENDPSRFWPRPSATTKPYDASASSGSNLGPTNPAFIQTVRERVATLQAAAAASDPQRPIPIDLVTASGSGLDPHISVAAARHQAPRVAHARGLTLTVVDALIDAETEGRLLGLFGEPRVNVARLNRHLDSRAR